MDVLDIDVYEHNEAFASASCAVAQEVGIPEDRFNLHGGAVALGHPFGQQWYKMSNHYDWSNA